MNDNIKVPNHIAIILDGNGRWAKKRGLPRNLGHRKGAFNLRDTAINANELGIKQLTVYAFSTENWNRPKEEVGYLMSAPLKYLKKYKKKLFNSNYKITFIGRRDRFSKEFLNAIEEMEDGTKNHTGLQVNIAVDYGSRDELTTVVKEISKKVKENKIDINDINENTIEEHLFTRDMYPIDLMIRTSGEIRLSNYLLWQLAYSEFYFTDTYWPDFNKKELIKAIESYTNRDRRYGGLKK